MTAAPLHVGEQPDSAGAEPDLPPSPNRPHPAALGARTPSLLHSSITASARFLRLGSMDARSSAGGGGKGGIVGALLSAIGLGGKEAEPPQAGGRAWLLPSGSLGRGRLAHLGGQQPQQPRSLARLSSAAFLRDDQRSNAESFQELRNDSFTMSAAVKLAKRCSRASSSLDEGRLPHGAPAPGPLARLSLPAPQQAACGRGASSAAAACGGAQGGGACDAHHAPDSRRSSTPGLGGGGGPASSRPPSEGRLPRLKRLASVDDRPPTPRYSRSGHGGSPTGLPSSVSGRLVKMLGSFRLPDILGGGGAAVGGGGGGAAAGGKHCSGTASGSPSGSPLRGRSGTSAADGPAAALARRVAPDAVYNLSRSSHSASHLAQGGGSSSPGGVRPSGLSGSAAKGPWAMPARCGSPLAKRISINGAGPHHPTAFASPSSPSGALGAAAALSAAAMTASNRSPVGCAGAGPAAPAPGPGSSILQAFQNSLEDEDGAALMAVEEEFGRRFGCVATSMPGAVDPSPPAAHGHAHLHVHVAAAAPHSPTTAGPGRPAQLLSGPVRRGTFCSDGGPGPDPWAMDLAPFALTEPPYATRASPQRPSFHGASAAGKVDGAPVSSSKMRLASIRQSCQGGIVGPRLQVREPPWVGGWVGATWPRASETCPRPAREDAPWPRMYRSARAKHCVQARAQALS